MVCFKAEYIEDITWWCEDMNLIFKWQNNVLRTSARREITKITSLINSRVRLWKINHSGSGCSFYEFYEWYILQ